MRGNRMGPEEQGAKTGRGLGFCNGYDQPGFMNDAEPMGMRRGLRQWGGRGRGRGFRRFWNTVPADSVNSAFDKSQSEILNRLVKLEEAILELKDNKEA